MYLLMFRLWFLVSRSKGQNLKEEEIVLIGYMTVVVMLLSAMLIAFFMAFQKRKNKLLLDKIRQQKEFEETVAETREEIQEQTLKYIGQELHDNVGQLLSLASMQMGMLGAKVTDDIKVSFVETQKTIKDSLEEVRTLSRALNTDVIQNRGFLESVRVEIERLNRMKLITANFMIIGDIKTLENKKDGIILFRILQEFISNTVKHSNASELNISFEYKSDQLIIKAADDGKGFIVNDVKNSSGVLNMKSRAELTQSSYSLTSQPNEGTELTMIYPIVERSLKTTEVL